MSYESNQDLPWYLRSHLPEHIQNIYRTVFNNACEEYAAPEKHQGFTSLAEVAHHVAWAAVKKEIERTGVTLGSEA